MDEQDMITVVEAAAQLGVSRVTLDLALVRFNIQKYRRLGDRQTFIERVNMAELAKFRPAEELAGLEPQKKEKAL